MLHRKPRARGFTLIEILCVVVILGIASAIIIPQLGSRDDLQAAAAARLIIADVIYAQNMAISRQRKHYIQFVDQQYTLLSRESELVPLAVITHPVTKDPYVTTIGNARSGIDNVRLEEVDFASLTILGFDELGMPFGFDGSAEKPLNSAGTITVRCGQNVLTINIEPFTGEASVN